MLCALIDRMFKSLGLPLKGGLRDNSDFAVPSVI